jgi:voltage-gated potassium channel Kch
MDDAHTLTAGARHFLSSTMLRGIAFMTVFGAALLGFSLGVSASERDLAAMGLAEHAYYSLGLFVLGGLDIGTPVGGPSAARALVWCAYFAAPIITAFAIVEAVLRIFGPLGLRLRRLSGHVVVAGAGRLTAQYVRELRNRDARRPIVIVERDSAGSYLAELARVHRAFVVQGDIASDRVLDELRLSHADRVLLFTSDDFANLDAAAKIIRAAPRLHGRVVVHVSDLRFMQETSGSSVSRHCEIFNGHEFAARHLVEDQLVRRFQATPGRDPIVLAGFGRFGRTVLDQLQRQAPDSFGPVVIIDHDATHSARVFEEGPGFSRGYEQVILDGEILDPEVWVRANAAVVPAGVPPVFIFGSASDGTNLQAALSVRKEHPDAHIVVRGFRASPFTEEVAEEARLHAVNLGKLVRDGMPERWF